MVAVVVLADAKRLAGGAVSPARPDPVTDVARKYLEVCRKRYATTGMTDEVADAWDAEIAKLLETQLMTAWPKSREGIVALLDVALHLELDNIDHQIEEEPWLDRLVLWAFEHARDAIEAGAGC